jgi:ABC transport system ATP-binding/permease protein
LQEAEIGNAKIEEVALLINAQGLTKSYGASPLFRDITVSISDGERLGLIGPNGSGKSTLLEVLSGRREPDAGDVAIRKNTRLAYIAQDSQFTPGDSIRTVVRRSLEVSGVPEQDRAARESEVLGKTGFLDFDAEAASLSGGWRKRLAIAEALVQNPDVLLLDEPTNHLDLAGIEWLEKLLLGSRFASVIISHDRYFLENVATDIMELNRVYPDGIYRVRGNYSKFLEAKEEFLHAQAKHQEALENRVRTEIEWLRRGPKARATKAKARIDKAHELIGELAGLNARTRTSSAGIDFTATDRKTKRLAELKNVSYGFGDRTIVKDLSFVFTAGTRVGLVGPNGSGKTTLLRLLRDEVSPQSGDIRLADNLRVVYFEQNRVLDPDVTLRRALAPDGDSVVYQGRVIHVASWASRFLFASEQLNQPVGRLSGGERARVLIARLMLEPADLLLLDEPTNDLDIPTLEILEESLIEFAGALVLVTHDRYLLDRVSTVVLGLDGRGGAGTFADYSQWDAWMDEQEALEKAALSKTSDSKSAAAPPPPPPAKKKLSYLENREYESIETRIAEAEQLLADRRRTLEDPEVMRDGLRLQEAYTNVEKAQQSVDELYARWEELESKLS